MFQRSDTQRQRNANASSASVFAFSTAEIHAPPRVIDVDVIATAMLLPRPLKHERYGASRAREQRTHPDLGANVE